MTSAAARTPAWLCFLALSAGATAGSEVPLVRQVTIDSSFSGVTALAAGDIDGDGIEDLVGAAETAGDFGWWRGSDAAVTFGYLTITTIDAAFDGAKAVALGDVDGDGDLDVVAAATTDLELAWWANNGDGTGWTKDVISSGAAGRGVAVADVDRDGTLDVVAAGGDVVRWFSNDAGDGSAWTGSAIAGAASFGGARGVAVGDLDDDGDVDVAAVAETDGDVAWFESSSAGTVWTRHDLDTTFPEANGVAIADLDGDGSLDVVALTDNPPDGDVTWWEVPAGTAHPIGAVVGGASLAVADIDRDGDLDVAVGGDGTAPSDDVVWFENTLGDGSAFTERTVEPTFDQATALVAADLDGDGDADLAGGSFADDDVVWWSNDTVHRSASFRDRVTVTNFAGPPGGLAAGDLDGDGDLDLVTAHLAGGVGLQPKALWLENTGGAFGTFVEHEIDATFSSLGGLTLGDLDGDGDLDVIVGYGSSVGQISWYVNDGTPAVGEWSEQPIDGDVVALGSPSSLAVADIDRDGTLDVVAALRDDDDLVWYSNDNGDGSSWTRTDVDSNYNSPDAVRVADLDADGRIDLLAASGVQSLASWWEDVSVAGDGSSWTEHTIDAPVGAVALAVGDVDDDGDLDVYIGHSSASVKSCLNDGDASSWTCNVLDITSTGSVQHLAIADLDGDGDQDAATVVASTDSGRIRWIDRRPVQNGKVDVDLAFAEGEGLVVADLDGDGDLDLAAASNCGDGGCSPVNEVAAWENAGGQFSLATTDTAPAEIASAGADDVLRIDARHLGRDGFSFHPLDSDIELTSLELLFEESGGDPLGSGEMDALVDRVEVWLDDELAGTVDAFDAQDDLVATVSTPFTLSSGVLSLPFVSGDAAVLLEPDSAMTGGVIENIRTYFVVVGLTADASSQTPASFQVTHLTEASSTAQDAEALLPLRLEWAANAGTEVITAGAAGPPDHLLIQSETLTGSDTREACLTITADPDVVIQAGATVVFRAADQVVLGDGFQVESAASFRIEMSSPALCP